MGVQESLSLDCETLIRKLRLYPSEGDPPLCITTQLVPPEKGSNFDRSQSGHYPASSRALRSPNQLQPYP